jgi:hypothetical protein
MEQRHDAKVRAASEISNQQHDVQQVVAGQPGRALLAEPHGMMAWQLSQMKAW